MFYFDKVLDKTVLKSTLFNGVNHFFTTKELILKTKEENLINEAEKQKELIKKEFKLDRLIHPKQTHTNNIQIVKKDVETYLETDALILDDNKTGIFLNFADCTPIILYDFKLNIGAIAHGGWRGAVQKIAPLTVLKMEKEFNSNPNDIKALIGPNICFNCFETSEEIMNELKNTVKNNIGTTKEENGKFYADLKEINKRQLIEVGIKEIDVTAYCTFHNNNLFFSYRKENKTTNRMSAFLSLKN